MIDANDAFTVAERYRPTAINNVRSKYVVYVNSRCASTVPSALAKLLVANSQPVTCGSVPNLIHVVEYGTTVRFYSIIAKTLVGESFQGRSFRIIKAGLLF